MHKQNVSTQQLPLSLIQQLEQQAPHLADCLMEFQVHGQVMLLLLVVHQV